MENLLCFCLKVQGVHFYQIGSFKYTSLGMCVSLPKYLLLHEIDHGIERGCENCSLAGIKTRHPPPQKKGLTWVGLADVISFSVLCQYFLVLENCFALTTYRQKFNCMAVILIVMVAGAANVSCVCPCARHCATHGTPLVSQSCLVGAVIVAVPRK